MREELDINRERQQVHSESQEETKRQEVSERQEELKHQEAAEHQEEMKHQEIAEIQTQIEESLLELPIVQYAWISEEEIPFSERVRSICKEECPRYGTSWSCPPGVGSVEQCRQRCGQFLNAFLFTTIAEVNDTDNMEETLATRPAHEAVTKEVQKILEIHFGETLALSAQSCAICRACAYPEEPCRYPDKMLPCIEGYGIVVPPLAEKAGIEFVNGAGIVTWFGMILFSKITR